MLMPFLKKKEDIVSRGSTSRIFEYEKKGITLKFTLRTDTKDELDIFLKLLKVAIIDVENEINK